MSALAVGMALLLVFAMVETLAAKIGPRGGASLRWLLAAAFAAMGCELARFDHGRPEWLLWIGFVAAPVLVIFGGAAWGVRRWYGWPDLGPLPGRLALAAVGLVAGVLVGQQMKEADVRESQERGVAIRTQVRAWRAAHADEWPKRLEDAVPNPPTSRMGALAPPPFTYDVERRTLSFPIRTGTDLVLDLDVGAVQWKVR